MKQMEMEEISEEIVNTEAENEKIPLGEEILSWIKMLTIVFLIVTFIQTFMFVSVRVQGMSMYPTLSDGERVILWSLFYEPDALDIVVLEHETGENYVKRIIGVPGDTIDYFFGNLYINDNLIHEPYIYSAPSTGWFTLSSICQFENCYEIPEDYFLVLGDNRNFSEDSRHIGLINRSQIRGEVTWRYWPIRNLGNVNR